MFTEDKEEQEQLRLIGKYRDRINEPYKQKRKHELITRQIKQIKKKNAKHMIPKEISLEILRLELEGVNLLVDLSGK